MDCNICTLTPSSILCDITQCVHVAPSSFLMLESGRARTFEQHNTADVPLAVSVCPVNCMHKVAFHELKEMEVARDHGDGRSDHRHLGRGHTPLSVAGIDSDANHKSSWYHYLKNKCHGKHNVDVYYKLLSCSLTSLR